MNSPLQGYQSEKQLFSKESSIYLDYQATTPCDPEVVEAMKPYFIEYFGNPHSRNHQYGWDAEGAVEIARSQVAKSIGADPREIIFTSGATEANNLAIKGAAWFRGSGHMITLKTEHKCVLEPMRFLESQGFSVTYLSVPPSGILDLETLEAAIRPDTFLVSIGAVNGEIGVIQPIEAIGALCKARHILFHTDAAQALGKLDLTVDVIDLMSLSSHKIYGPKGVGALFVRRKPRVRLRPLFHGGGQERGIRSGTVPPFLCVGFGKACEIAVTNREEETRRLQEYRDWFYGYIQEHLDAVFLNGDLHQRIAGNLNLSFLGVEGEGLMMGLKQLALSSGSACTSASLEPSYVLKALGVKDDMAHNSLRFSFGRFTTWEEVKTAATQVVEVVNKLRRISPLWEMHQEGIDLDSVQWISH